MIGTLLRRARGNAIVLAHLRGQRRAPYLPPEKLAARRDARLRRLVAYAAGTVPYWSEFFRDRGIDPRDVRSVADLARLPLLDKAAVRADPSRLVSNSRTGRRSVAFLTSGTTASPLIVHHDESSLLANIAFGERERAVVARACGREFGYREAAITYGGATLRRVWEFYRTHTFVPVRPTRLELSVEARLDVVVGALNDFRPDVLVGYGSYLETLFRVVAARGLRLYRPRVVFYGADAMTEPGRRLIEDEFGAVVLAQYNAVEAFKIGFGCEAGQGYHLHEDLCWVSLVDGAGRPVPDGQPGEIVLTNLVNRGTVLLNYRLGDVGVRATSPCACGRTLPRLAELRGRVGEVLVLPGGRLVHPSAVWGVFRQTSDVLRYQLVQEEPTRFLLRVLATDRAAYDDRIGGILERLRDLLGSVTVEPVFDPELEFAKAGKFRPVVSHCADQAVR